MGSVTAPTNRTPESCKVSHQDVRSCLNFDAMWQVHPLNWKKSDPFPFKKPGTDIPLYVDQCAIKMSIALEAGGLSIDKSLRSEVREVKELGRKVRGALAAEELANWLIKTLGKPELLKPTSARDSIMKRRGIVFFKDFWQRPNEKNAQGDHIDLWDKDRTPHTVPAQYTTRQRNSDDDYGRDHYFLGAKEIWFWELKK